jgi:hypothetical protein
VRGASRVTVAEWDWGSSKIATMSECTDSGECRAKWITSNELNTKLDRSADLSEMSAATS